MAKTYSIHSAYNAQEWERDEDGKVVVEDGRPIVDNKSRYYDRRSETARVPHSIVVLQPEDNFETDGALPELLTAKAIQNLSKLFGDLEFLEDTDYPLNSSEDISQGEAIVTQSGNPCIKYYYKFLRPKAVEM